MKNCWLNKIDKALRCLGYDTEIMRWFTDNEKESIIIDEYLFYLRENADDCASLSVEEMAEFIIDHKRG